MYNKEWVIYGGGGAGKFQKGNIHKVRGSFARCAKRNSPQTLRVFPSLKREGKESQRGGIV
jgi:hypothetical protein